MDMKKNVSYLMVFIFSVAMINGSVASSPTPIYGELVNIPSEMTGYVGHTLIIQGIVIDHETHKPIPGKEHRVVALDDLDTGYWLGDEVHLDKNGCFKLEYHPTMPGIHHLQVIFYPENGHVDEKNLTVNVYDW